MDSISLSAWKDMPYMLAVLAFLYGIGLMAKAVILRYIAANEEMTAKRAEADLGRNKSEEKMAEALDSISKQQSQQGDMLKDEIESVKSGIDQNIAMVKKAAGERDAQHAEIITRLEALQQQLNVVMKGINDAKLPEAVRDDIAQLKTISNSISQNVAALVQHAATEPPVIVEKIDEVKE